MSLDGIELLPKGSIGPDGGFPSETGTVFSRLRAAAEPHLQRFIRIVEGLLCKLRIYQCIMPAFISGILEALIDRNHLAFARQPQAREREILEKFEDLSSELGKMFGVEPERFMGVDELAALPTWMVEALRSHRTRNCATEEFGILVRPVWSSKVKRLL
jgi:hypothetical protein